MTNPFRSFAIVVLASTTLITWAQETQQPSIPHIEVAGQAEMQVVPDEIHIAIVLQERGAGSNKVTVESQEVALKNAVKALGIDTTALTLSHAIADLVPMSFRSDDVIARKRYLLKVGDAETVRKAFLELDRLQIQDASIQRVRHSKEEEYASDMRIKAIQAAKRKADEMLAAIGEHTGHALEVSDLPVPDPRPGVRSIGMDRVFGGTTAKHRLVPEPDTYRELGIGFSHITIKAQVYCVFGIAQK